MAEREDLFESLQAEVCRLGADRAAVIDAARIETDRAFRDMCAANACGMYGKCWMCPPDIGDIHELIDKVHSYGQGLLYQTIGTLEDSFDIEGMQEAGFNHARVSQKVESALQGLVPEKHLHLSCGGCHLCEICTKPQGLPCRHPDRALPSLEGYGVDVYNTTKNTPLAYINGQNTVTYFGAVLFREA